MKKSAANLIHFSSTALRWAPILLCFLGTQLSAQQVNLEVWTIDQGMPQSQVRSMIQDRRGYLWVCTFSGIARFNGSSWLAYSKRDGLPRNEVASIYEDRQGRIYLGLEKGGLVASHDGEFRVLGTHPRVETATVLEILRDKKGLWVGTNEGVACIREDGSEYWHLASGLPGEICQALLAEPETDSILVGTDLGLVRIANGTVQELVGLPPKTSVRDMITTRNGEIYLATSNGLWQLKSGSLHQVRVMGRPLEQDMLCLVEGEDGALWLGTTNEGVLGLKDNRMQLINRQTGLPDEKILSLVFDQEGSLWIGTDAALARYSPGPFMFFTTNEGLPNNFLRAIYQDRQGGIWMGTRNGMGYKAPGEDIVTLPGYEGKRIYGISGDSKGRIFAATREHGLLVRENNSIKKYSLEEGLPSNSVLSVFVDSRDRIWLSCKGLVQWSEEAIEVTPSDHILENIKIMEMKEDRDGLLWLGTNKGLITWDPNRKIATVIPELADITIWSVEIDSKNRIWAGTNGEGLICLDGTSIQRLNTDNGLTNDYVWFVLCLSDGVVWAGHNLGIDRIERGRVLHYTKKDGLADNEASATVRLNDGQSLWFGSALGLTRYQPGVRVDRGMAPAIFMDAVQVNGKPIDLTGIDYFDSDRNHFEFFYSGVWLSGGLTYRYRLEGVDEQWSNPTTNTSVKYLNLAPGSYRFLVQAVNSHGVWSEVSATYAFRIARAWYHQPWLQFVLVLVLFSLVLLVMRLRTLQMEKKRIVLENLVNLKTRDLSETNKRLEATQEKLVSAAHGAGMAETAIRILHNVGNALNSVNVSISVIDHLIRNPREDNLLGALIKMMEPHRDNLDRFVTEDPRGRQVPSAFLKLLELVQGNREKANLEVKTLQSQVENIAAIIKEQEAYTLYGSFLEPVEINLLIQDALRIENDYIEKSRVRVECNPGPVPGVKVARVKLVLVLINLLRNAVDALQEKADWRMIWIETRVEGDGICILFRDNGCGFDPKDKERIFFNGYSTHEGRPGFGLHFCANSLTEMGGWIKASSEGPQTGTQVTLWFPLNPPNKG